MAAETTQSIRERARRPAPDLVASDEALSCLLVGLENLRCRLETARRERAQAAKPHATAAAAVTRVEPREREEIPASGRQWYYEPELVAL